MATKSLPEPELLRKLLRYEPESGKLFWRERPVSFFNSERDCRAWNTRYANREALTATNGNGYKFGMIFNDRHSAHRVIVAMVNGKWPGEDVDHINGDKADNRIANLRCVTRAENCRNQKRPRNNTSGFVGVCWSDERQFWIVRLMFSGKRKYIGSFKTLDDAICARRKANIRFGFHPNHGRLR